MTPPPDTARSSPRGPQERLARGVRRAVRMDATAVGYSILVTATFAAVNLQAPPVTVARLFAFVVGASLAFTMWEAIVTRGFRVSLREERSDVLLVGTALAPLSIVIGLATALGVLAIVPAVVSWMLAPLAASAVYVLATGTHLAVARRYEEKHPADEER